MYVRSKGSRINRYSIWHKLLKENQFQTAYHTTVGYETECGLIFSQQSDLPEDEWDVEFSENKPTNTNIEVCTKAECN